MTPWKRATALRLSRDSALFLAGLAGFAYEVLREGAERPSLLMICAGMMGLPVYFSKDRARRDGDGDE